MTAQLLERQAAAAQNRAQRRDGATEPVFVDGSGRRRRLARMLAAVLGIGILFGLALVVVSFVGGGSVRLPGLPASGDPPQDQARQPDFYPAAPGLAFARPATGGHAP